MAIKVGDKIPAASLKYKNSDGIQTISTADLFKGKTVVLFALPGAFTPTCSAKHLPGFINHAGDFKSKGVDTIACLSVNDAFVMDAWGKDQKAGDKVMMLADGNGEFSKAVGPDNGCLRLWHGHAVATLCDGGEGRRGQGAECRSAGRLRGVQRRGGAEGDLGPLDILPPDVIGGRPERRAGSERAARQVTGWHHGVLGTGFIRERYRRRMAVPAGEDGGAGLRREDARRGESRQRG